MNAVPKTRGRPFAKSQQRDETVPNRLLAVAAELIGQKGHFDITDREIADRAGVTTGMVNYYFGSKDGLLFAVVESYAGETTLRLKEAELVATDEPWQSDTSGRIFEILGNAYNAQPGIAALLIAGILKPQSFIHDEFMRRYGHRTPTAYKRIFEKLIERGLYSNKTDTSFAAIALYSILVAPHMLAPIIKQFDPRMDNIANQEWLDFVSRLFDQLFDARSA